MTARNKTQGSQPAITCTEWVRKPYDALRDYVKCSGPEREPVHTRISNTTAHDTTDQGRTGRENMSLDSTRLPCAEAVRALSTRENGGAERNPVCPLPRAARSDSARAGGRPRPGDRYGEARAYDRRGRSRERILSKATDPRRSDETVNSQKPKRARLKNSRKPPHFLGAASRKTKKTHCGSSGTVAQTPLSPLPSPESRIPQSRNPVLRRRRVRFGKWTIPF